MRHIFRGVKFLTNKIMLAISFNADTGLLAAGWAGPLAMPLSWLLAFEI